MKRPARLRISRQGRGNGGAPGEQQPAPDDLGAWHELLLHSIGEGVIALDADGAITWVNEAACRKLGYREQELLGQHAHELIHHSRPDGSAYPPEECPIRTASEEIRKGSGEVFFRRDGTPFDVEYTVSLLGDARGHGSLVVFRNVTARKEAERERRRAEALYRLVVDASEDMIALKDEQARFTFVSPAYTRLLGYREDELIGTSVRDLVHPDDLPAADALGRALIAAPARRSSLQRKRLRRKDGSWLWVEGHAVALPEEDGRARLLLTSDRDITEQMQAEQALRESEARFRAIYEGSLDAMLLSDDRRVFLDANAAACELLGRSRDEIIGHRQEDITGSAAETAIAAWERFLAQGEHAGQWRTTRPDRTVRVIDYRSSANVLPGVHLSILRDVSTQASLEEQFRQAQRLEAVGRLAGGVAHDFNNLLTALLGYADLASNALGEREPPVRERLREIRSVTMQARDLTQHLLAFSRRQALEPRVIDLDQTVSELVPLLQRIIGDDVCINAELNNRGAHSLLDPSALQQILANLAVNARDAMPDGGTITIQTATTQIGQHEAAALKLDVGAYALIRVRDDGTGIPPETLGNIFEPFFTTKAVGVGTGLGLSTVHGIVSQSGGAIEVESTLGAGTTFTIYLPLTAPSPQRPTTPASPAPDLSEGSILLVEDNPTVRKLAEEMLTGMGYAVTGADDPAQALALAESRPEGFDLMISDMVMPQMSGSELAEKIKNLHPRISIVYISGHSGEIFGSNKPRTDQALFLEKPFSMRELSATVEAALRR